MGNIADRVRAPPPPPPPQQQQQQRRRQRQQLLLQQLHPPVVILIGSIMNRMINVTDSLKRRYPGTMQELDVRP